MPTTLVGFYTAPAAAAGAIHDLAASGLPHGILYHEVPDILTPPAHTLADADAPGTATRQALWTHLLTAGVPAAEATAYLERVSRGGALVVIKSTDDAAGHALAILNRWQPVPFPGELSTAGAPNRQKARSIPVPPQSQGFLGGLGIGNLARRVIQEVLQDRCLTAAAALAYYLVFAAFPFLLFVATLLGYLPIPQLMDTTMEYLARLLPGDAMTLVRDNLRQLLSEQRGGLLSLGIAVSLWTASSAVVAIMDALNQSYDVEEGRPFWKVRGVAILLTLGLSLFLIVSMVLLLFGPMLGAWVADLVGLGSVFELTWNILRWLIIVGLLIVAMALVYYWAPDVQQRWKWITPGAVFAVLSTIVVSLGFSFYVNNFGAYNKTYGSIGAVIVFLTWLYLTGLVILVGGEINAEIEHAAPDGKAPGQKTGA